MQRSANVNGLEELTMAKISNRDDHGLRLEPSTTVPTIHVQDLKVPLDGDKKSRGDPLAEMQRNIRLAQRQASASSGLAVQGFDFGFDGLEVTNVGRLLKLAQEHLGQQEYQAALDVLLELLREAPQHPEALYFKAFAHHGLQQHRSGLQALASLRDAQDKGATVVPRLLSDANQLRTKLWAGIAPLVMDENYTRIKESKVDELLREVEDLLALDPLVWEFHYLKAEGLFAADRNDEALAATLSAIEMVKTRPIKPLAKVPEALAALRDRIYSFLARVRMEPAREMYINADYAGARRTLAGLDAEIRGTKLAGTFDAYLGRLLSSPKKRPKDVPLEGTLAETDEFNFFLVGGTMAIIRMARTVSMYVEAEELIHSALAYAPHFAYLKFLAAMTSYQALISRFENDDPPPLAEAIHSMDRALANAEASRADPEIEGIDELIEAIERLKALLDKVRVEQERMEEDRKLLEPLLDEYRSIMEALNAGIEDVKIIDQLSNRMKKLQKKVPDCGPLVSEQARDLKAKLGEAIALRLQDFTELKDAFHEAEKIGALWKRLSAEADAAKYSSSAATMAGRLAAIAKDAKSLRAKSAVPQARESLDELLSTINRILSAIGYGHMG